VVLSAGLEQALHRCIILASPFGTIRLLPARNPPRQDEGRTPHNPPLPGEGRAGAVREFFLELDRPGSPRLRWTLRTVDAGTELFIARPASITRLARLGRRGSGFNTELDRLLTLLRHAVNMKIVVIGGGTGLYTTLLGLRDRSWSLTAIISGLPRAVLARDPKDQLGSLPRDDASLCLVALAPSVRENVVLRSLLAHRMESHHWRGAHFGTALLQALEETGGSRQAALDTAGQLLGIRGRVAIALDSAARAIPPRESAVDAIAGADLIVIAPGHLELDLMPVLCCPGMIAALQRSAAVKVVVTKIMTAEDASEEATTSHQVRALAMLSGCKFDVVVANQGSFSKTQLQRYAAAGARPVIPDVQATSARAHEVVTEALSAPGDLARHDPERLGECLLEVGAQWLGRRAEQAS
jgi:2-phospho-L-lactate transferase/gluconeogenesis factor (CofD/UPF0052 family)